MTCTIILIIIGMFCIGKYIGHHCQSTQGIGGQYQEDIGSGVRDSMLHTGLTENTMTGSGEIITVPILETIMDIIMEWEMENQTTQAKDM